MFNLIHPSIIDLYCNIINLQILQDKVRSVIDVTPELQKEIDSIANDYIISAQKAETFFTNSDFVQNQIDILMQQKGLS